MTLAFQMYALRGRLRSLSRKHLDADRESNPNPITSTTGRAFHALLLAGNSGCQPSVEQQHNWIVRCRRASHVRRERAREVGGGVLCNRDKVDTAGGVPTEERFSGATEPIVLSVCPRNANIFKQGQLSRRTMIRLSRFKKISALLNKYITWIQILRSPMSDSSISTQSTTRGDSRNGPSSEDRFPLIRTDGDRFQWRNDHEYEWDDRVFLRKRNNKVRDRVPVSPSHLVIIILLIGNTNESRNNIWARHKRISEVPAVYLINNVKFIYSY